MAPVHESDVDRQRFNASEWNTYEFWEKVESRLKWRNRLWFVLAGIVFLSIAAVPVVTDSIPKWKAMVASRRLAEEINRLKREAGANRLAYRIVFKSGTLEFGIFKSEHCKSTTTEWVRSGSLIPSSDQELTLLDLEIGSKLGFNSLLTEFCYDAILGAEFKTVGADHSGFAVIPGKDLTQSRLDRVVFLILSGPSAQITFE